MVKAVIGRPPEVVAIGVAHAKLDPGGFLGPWLMAIIGYTFLMGIIIVQTTRYFSAYGIESWILFTLVVLSTATAAAQWGVLLSAGWEWFVVNYGDWELIISVPWQCWASPVINSVIIFVSQLFFAHRCYTLYGRSKLIFGGLLLGMLTTIVTYALVGMTVAIDPYNFDFAKKFAFPATTVSLVTDFSVTGLTVWKLRKYGGMTFSPDTHDVLHRLRNITLEAAAPPAFFTLLNMICYFSMGAKNIVFTFFAMLVPCLYVNSLLFVLNSRIGVRRKFSPNRDSETLSTRFEFSPVSGTKTHNTDASNVVAVLSTTTVPDFAPTAPPRLTGERLGVADKRRETAVDTESLAESKSELQVDLDRWDNLPPSPHSKDNAVERLC